jgi:hypothetical protein
VTTAYTSLLGLALPVTGELSGTWGDVVNNSITSLLDSAVAGTTTISSDADVTLTTTTGASNQAREAIILWTASGTVTRTITAPAQSKTYIVINKTGSTQSIKLVGVGPTSGVTIVAGESALCSWNGIDFIKVGSTIANAAGSNTQLQFNSSGVLGASANLTWDGSTLTVTGALSASADSAFTSTGALTISKGTTAQRAATPVTGMLRYNSTTNEFEGYSGASPAWKSVGGSAISNDTSTSSNVYPLFAAATTGTAQNIYTSNANLLYKPSTGEFTSSILNAGNGIVVNNSTVSASYTIATNNNGFSVGPVTIASGQSVTVSSGQRWLVF